MGKCKQPKFDVIQITHEQAKSLHKDTFMESAAKNVGMKVEKETEMGDVYVQERKGAAEASFPFRGAEERSVYVKVSTSSTWKNSRFFEVPQGATRIPHTNPRYQLFANKTAVDIFILPGNAEQKKMDATILKRQNSGDVSLPDEGIYSKSLPAGVEVLSVTYGHYNKDGLTDLKLELSTGGAIILQQRDDSCQEKSKPKEDPKPRPKAWQGGADWGD